MWSRRSQAVLVASATLLALVPSTSVHGASERVSFDLGGVGPHEIRTLTVANSGNRVEVDVRHADAGWKGRVKVTLVTGEQGSHSYGAVIRRSGGLTLTEGNGAAWDCRAVDAKSRIAKATTVFAVPRRCMDDTSSVTATVVSHTRGLSKDRAKSPSVPKQVQPNIVVIMVDDMRDDDVQYMPVTERLIGEAGVRFANSFSPYPLCCPARSSFLLGQYSHNHEVWSHRDPYGFHAFNDRSTLATWLQDSGYATAMIGKYLNGYGVQPAPDGSSETSEAYVPPGWTDWRGAIKGGLPQDDPQAGGVHRMYDTTLNVNGLRFDNYEGKYQTSVFGRLSKRIIRERARSDDPFFLFASYAAPHHGGPGEDFDPPRRIRADDGSWSRFKTTAIPPQARHRFDDVITEAPGAAGEPDPSDKPSFLRDLVPPNRAERDALLEVTRQRAVALSVVDRQVGKTIRALRVANELDDTLVIFTSDNGYFLGEHNIRQGKTLPYDPSLRVPLLMRGPGIAKGELRHDPFMTIDLAPTILEVAGVRADPNVVMDGVSLLQVARSGDQGWTRPVLTETGPRSTIRSTDEAGEPLSPDSPGAHDQRYIIGIRTDRYLFTDIASGENELYDMLSDPAQDHNVVDDPRYAGIVHLMREALRSVRACNGIECSAPLPPELQTPAGRSVLTAGSG